MSKRTDVSPIILELRKTRKEQKKTQADVAVHVGSTRAAVGHWELGLADPPLSKVKAYADFVSMNVSLTPKRSRA